MGGNYTLPLPKDGAPEGSRASVPSPPRSFHYPLIRGLSGAFSALTRLNACFFNMDCVFFTLPQVKALGKPEKPSAH